MNQYYLIAQLPSLETAGETTALPITEERFFELCKSNLGKKAWNALSGLTLVPKRQNQKSGYPFIDKWNEWEKNFRLALAAALILSRHTSKRQQPEWEKNFRLALACARAEKMKKTFEEGTGEVCAKQLLTVRKAVEMEDPLEAERYLTRARLEFLETLRPADPFSETMLFYYALKLKLIVRIRQFDQRKGQSEYRKIYGSIMYGGDQEVKE